MKIIIWGFGIRGKRLFSKLRKEEVIAFIDNNPAVIGTIYEGKPVISYEQYKVSYRQYYIVVTPLSVEAINQQLKEDGIFQYGNLTDCPAELQGVNDISYLDKYLASFDKRQTYQIIGESFYSIYTAVRLTESGVKDLCLCGTLKWLHMLQLHFPDLKTEMNGKHPADLILNTAGENTAKGDWAKNELDIFDLVGKIKEYRCERLEEFHNIHKGEKCFIIATGPSLQMEDLQRIKASGIKTISMNKIFLAFDKTDWRPDYYVAADSDIIRENENWIKNCDIPYRFISDQYPKFWKDEETNHLYKYHLQQTNPKEGVTFSANIIDGMYGSGTVTFICMQIAVYMGFSEIYLLGVDHTIPRGNTKNHFVENYAEKSNIDYHAYHNLAEAEYCVAQSYACMNNIRIYNATRGGNLAVFDRINLDSVLSNV